MRILLVAGVDLSLPGGLERHVLELAGGLAARGHDVEIFGRPAELPPFRMVRDIDPARYDVIHHHGGGWPRGLEPGDRYVRTLHFCVAAKMARYVELGRLRTLVHPGNWRAVAHERAAARRRGRLIAVSHRVAEQFQRWHGIDASAVTVIPNGASFAPASEPRASLRRRHGIADDAPVLLTIGRADFVKGLGLLQRAWDAGPRGDAVWVGVGGDAPGRPTGPNGNRIVTGPVPAREVTNWVHAADLGAMPSYYEGCSLALMEMLATGLYVLGHDVGNAGEVLAEPRGRIVAPNAGAWRDALADALARRPRGVPLDDAFRWDAIVARTEAVYRRLDRLAGGPDRLS